MQPSDPSAHPHRAPTPSPSWSASEQPAVRFHRLLPHPGTHRRPLSLLRPPARPVPRPQRAPPRRLHGHGVQRGRRDLPRPGHLLELHLGHRSLRRVPGAAGGRRHHRDHRDLPRRPALRRPAPVVRPPQAHRPTGAVDAPDHPEAPEGERSLVAAIGRRSDRPVPRPGRCEFVGQYARPTPCWSSPTCSGCPKRTIPSFLEQLMHTGRSR